MIAIIGVGALGSHVALLLRNMNPTLRLVDFDRVEQKNTQAQFHSKMSLGRNKAQALKQTLEGMFGTCVEAIPHKLSSGNCKELLKTGTVDVVLDCTDNIEARRTIKDYCWQHQIPCLHGALSAAGDFARIVWEEHFAPDAEGAEAAATCIDGEHLPFFGMAAALMAVEAQRFLKTKKKRSFQLSPMGIIQLA